MFYWLLLFSNPFLLTVPHSKSATCGPSAGAKLAHIGLTPALMGSRSFKYDFMLLITKELNVIVVIVLLDQ